MAPARRHRGDRRRGQRDASGGVAGPALDARPARYRVPEESRRKITDILEARAADGVRYHALRTRQAGARRFIRSTSWCRGTGACRRVTTCSRKSRSRSVPPCPTAAWTPIWSRSRIRCRGTTSRLERADRSEAKARTGQVPKPATLAGTAEKRNPCRARGETAEMLDDRDLGAQQRRMHRAGEVLDVVDVERVDPDQRRARLTRYSAASPVRKGIARRGSAACPSARPSRCGPAPPCPAGRAPRTHPARCRGLGRAPDHDGLQIGQRLERQLRQVLAVGVAVERRVDVGAGVGHHLDLADLELDPGGVARARGLPAQEVADDRPREAGVGRHAVLDGVAEIQEGHADGTQPVWARSSSRDAGLRADAGDRLADLVVRRRGAGGDADDRARRRASPSVRRLGLGADRLVADRAGVGVDAVGVLDVERRARPCDWTSAARWQVLLEL